MKGSVSFPIGSEEDFKSDGSVALYEKRLQIDIEPNPSRFAKLITRVMVGSLEISVAVEGFNPM
jgi:hypothetical protein